MWLLKFAVGVMLVAGLSLIGGGVFLVVQRETDPRVQATVSDCESVAGGRYGPTTECTGSWVIGGKFARRRARGGRHDHRRREA